MEKITQLTARLFLGHIFLIAGLTKIGAYAGTQGYMEAMGVPGALLPPVILLEIAGGLAIIVGWKARYSAVLLAVFSIAAAAIFHNNFDDQMQTILFMKNFAIAGGLMLLAVHGAGAYSIDDRLARNTMTINKI
ncbi:MAG: DoxX family protein [Nitrosomonas sp.]|nr:DoxX family protein [Nitrosomonas sp.]